MSVDTTFKQGKVIVQYYFKFGSNILTKREFRNQSTGNALGRGYGALEMCFNLLRVKCAKRALIFKPLVRIKRAWSHRSDLNVAGETVTVITRRYIAVLKRFLRALNSSALARSTTNQQSFQEDGPATHTQASRDNLAWLQDRFKGRFFSSLCASVSWPPCSPDFTAPGFSCGVPEEYCAPGGSRNLGNFEIGDPCCHSRDLPSLMFGRGGQTQSNAVFPRNTEISSTCHSESHELATESTGSVNKSP